MNWIDQPIKGAGWICFTLKCKAYQNPNSCCVNQSIMSFLLLFVAKIRKDILNWSTNQLVRIEYEFLANITLLKATKNQYQKLLYLSLKIVEGLAGTWRILKDCSHNIKVTHIGICFQLI